MTTKEIQQRNQKGKMRKPQVEKIRRDRINTSIEQLKLLLKDELKGRQLSSKLEKADILEMAVIYLKSKTPGQSYTDGFTRCLEETARFISAHNQTVPEKPVVERLLGPTQKPKSKVKTVCVSEKSSSISSGPNCPETNQTQLWRPW